jgi:hypothetical protein
MLASAIKIEKLLRQTLIFYGFRKQKAEVIFCIVAFFPAQVSVTEGSPYAGHVICILPSWLLYIGPYERDVTCAGSLIVGKVE